VACLQDSHHPTHIPPDHAVRLDTEASMRGITTRAVVSDEMASTTAQVVSTASRADDTPVSSDTTTNTFSGTRNREESCAPYSQHLSYVPKTKSSPLRGVHSK
jgi:hypothetical protein